ncbi:hypothetical protein GR925_27595 [Streptomyces sp. HUCO-GS316]|uniref:hypothetical protein n=1 Tax=Streptomyces sp. HUCO-GS316 TaxID=2692198 RepID=UPI00136AE69F|nr:hypothetical protein [Streptomyces sp. HUCO-GS316]MXM67091.1 hypothetical protein [Streptomyces sp. HUCO-GS316]
MSPVDVEDIERAYNAGLSVFGGCPVERSQVLELGEELRRYVDVLLPEATATAPRMRGEFRQCALHFLTRAHELLEQLDAAPQLSEEEAPLTERSPMRDRDKVFELASLCRTALSVVTRPGPLGEPAGLEEVERAVKRRVCGACWQPLTDGELVEIRVFDSDSGPGVHGFVHSPVCAPRRPLLRVVPRQPSPA